jgi:Domain of unknown function (DUF4263)
MKKFQTIEFDKPTYERELNEFYQLLSNNRTLQENKQILPFFKERVTLSSRIASIFYEFVNIDKIAYEYDLFGDFKCDLVVGDSKNRSYCFIEFEDAQPNSIFTSKQSKYKSEFSYRFEHGFSQIIDWFYLLNQVSETQMEVKFGSSKIDFHGLLVVGRNHFLTDSDSFDRLSWRSNHVIVNSKRIRVITYDTLLELLNDRYRFNYFQ